MRVRVRILCLRGASAGGDEPTFLGSVVRRLRRVRSESPLRHSPHSDPRKDALSSTRLVRRIVGWLAKGRSLYFVQTTLEAEGIPAPRGGDRWARTAAKRIATEDAYLPHSRDELAVLVEEVLTHAASPEDIRRAYRRYRARFEVDSEGTLTLRLSLGLDGGVLHNELSPR